MAVLPFGAVSPGGRSRQCCRPACAERAAVTLTYEYGNSQVWIDHLSDERDPHGYDLCRRHAERLSAPVGWHVGDRRAVTPTLFVVRATA